MSYLAAHAKRYSRHPTWFPDYLAFRKEMQALEGTKMKESEYEDSITEPWEMLGIDQALWDSSLEGMWKPEQEQNDNTVWETREPLLDIVGVAAQVWKPDHIVETGVEKGNTSAVILKVLEQNGKGQLHSIDLPPPGEDPAVYTGRRVPQELKANWDLIIGPSRKTLPPLIRRLGTIDIFIHDAVHTYESQIDEYRTAWPAIRRGGLLISDDVWSRAFFDFAASVGGTPRVGRRDAGGVYGAILKP